jgi:hypothetical protein
VWLQDCVAKVLALCERGIVCAGGEDDLKRERTRHNKWEEADNISVIDILVRGRCVLCIVGVFSCTSLFSFFRSLESFTVGLSSPCRHCRPPVSDGKLCC